jgi:hypothetical protein
MKLIYLSLFFIIGCNCKTRSNLIANKKNNQFSIVDDSFRIISDLDKNYVFVIESEKNLDNREILFKNFNVSNDLFLKDSIKIRVAIEKFLTCGIKIIDYIIRDSSSSNYMLPLVFERHPFESYIEKWDKVDNRELVIKTLIYDYFSESRSLSYFKRKENINKINHYFDFHIFVKWFNENKNLDSLSIKKAFKKEFPLGR